MANDKELEIRVEETNAMLDGNVDFKPAPDDVMVSTDENAVLSKMTKIGVIRSLAVISVSFMLLFSAFNSFVSLQSSLNKDEGLGTTGLASANAVTLLSNLLVTPITLSRFSPKWIMVVSIVTYIVYLMTGFYPSWYTIIPASIVMGIGAAHIWLAMQAYITDIARQYANITSTKHQDRLNLFLGIFYACHYTSNVWGNLVSSFVFQRVEANVTDDLKESVCGPNYCPYLEFNTSVILEPSRTQAYISCPYGIKNVGFVMVVFGICLSIFSAVFGKLTQYTGHMVLYVLGFLAQLCVQLTMLLWTPTTSHQYIIYIMAALFGVAGAVNIPLVSGLYNLYFPDNRAVALSCFRVLHAAGWTIAMAYSSWLCTQYKLYILISTLTLSMISLTILYIRQKRKSNTD
ncbi:Protein unc-93 A [Mactra antiquata]